MGKRGNGEGSIYQAADGRWVAAITLEGGKRKVRYAKTRKAAADKLAAALKDRRDGVPVTDDRITVKAYLERWLLSAKPTLRR